ncbi:uncharacterized protein LOC101234497 [Hydra vulgaris]|uniref:uncharacterized protein LOC101234497 n=1 Tax=Hydra vulgaris TaxID=6087 RepID=UPI0002B49AAE|nr:uncharacterized protein LOC101234497 [Hydra vulgaris]
MLYLPNDVPNGLIGLQTQKGQEMLKETTILNENFIKKEMKEHNRNYSGPASLAFVINALSAMQHVKFTEEMLNENDIIFAEKNGVNNFFQKINVGKNGVTLDDLSYAAMLLGFGTHSFYALHTNESNYDESKLKSLLKEKKWETSLIETEEKFREEVRDYIKRPVTGLIANFNMSKLGYDADFCQFSPIAAYHEKEDMFLIMNVWPYTPSAWVKTSLLFDAMSSIDTGSNLPHGFLRINVLV